MRKAKLFAKAMNAPQNLHFDELVTLVEAFGFRQSHVSGSYHIFSRADVPKLVNLQSVKGMAKAYQVRQFLRLVEEYSIRMEG